MFSVPLFVLNPISYGAITLVFNVLVATCVLSTYNVATPSETIILTVQAPVM